MLHLNVNQVKSNPALMTRRHPLFVGHMNSKHLSEIGLHRNRRVEYKSKL